MEFLIEGDNSFDDMMVLEKLFHPNLKLLLVTEGSGGCQYYTKVSIHVSIPPLAFNMFYLLHETKKTAGFLSVLSSIV